MAWNVLLIDNYDSYTFNLYNLLNSCFYPVDGGCGESVKVVVIRNDQISKFVYFYPILGVNIREKFLEILDFFDSVVISPGSGSPVNEKDFGLCSSVFEAKIPVLGVCLGFQGLAMHFGSKISRLREPAHGLVSDISVTARSRLLANFPPCFKSTRYHSLHIDHVEYPLVPVAYAHDESGSVLMAIEHATRPLFGVQFHPESICSENGIALMKNFYHLSFLKGVQLPLDIVNLSIAIDRPCQSLSPLKPKEKILTRSFKCDFNGVENTIFEHLYEKVSVKVWLDSARKCKDQGRFSAMVGFNLHDNGYQLIKYWKNGNIIQLITTSNVKWLKITSGTFAQYMHHVCLKFSNTSQRDLKFGPGCYGYFGYEMKDECNYTVSQPTDFEKEATTISIDPPLAEIQRTSPDSCFILTLKSIQLDHFEHVVTLSFLLSDENEHGIEHAKKWFNDVERCLKSVTQSPISLRSNVENSQQEPKLIHSDSEHIEKYLETIEKCKNYIRSGDTYETCLTTKFKYKFTNQPEQPFEFYKTLRQLNPAPFGAFMSYPLSDKIHSIASSSPEKFLSIDADGNVVMKPIKGTRKRSHDPIKDTRLIRDLKDSIKDRAENLMIVDLIRNDLSVVCETGSVTVPKLMSVETYETVHQMVTEVNGRSLVPPFQLLQSSFPPGSMTGAPKRRTVELLEKIEKDLNGEDATRGVYSGCIGYFGFDGSCDLSVIIRTVEFLHDDDCIDAAFGAGGAITILSDPSEEYEEMKTKAQSVYNSLFRVYMGRNTNQ